jgi:uncharacterized protein
MTQATVVLEDGRQPTLIADLLRPDAYKYAADDLHLYETHSSWAVLAGPCAYKLKKPVKPWHSGFHYDRATTRRPRGRATPERRFSPDVYLGSVEIAQDRGRFRVSCASGSDEPAVWMRRLPEQGMLPQLLARGDVDSRLVRRIGPTLARFYAAAATGPRVMSTAPARRSWATGTRPSTT